MAECDEQIAEARDSGDPVTRRGVRRGFARKALVLRAAGRFAEAVEVWAEAASWASVETEASEELFACRVRVQQAMDLGRAGDHAAAVRIAHDAAAQSGALAHTKAGRRSQAEALMVESAELTAVGRYEHAVGVAGDLVQRFDRSDDPQLRRWVAAGLAYRADARLRQGELGATTADSDQLIDRFLDESDLETQLIEARYLVLQARALLRLGGAKRLGLLRAQALLLASLIIQMAESLADAAGLAPRPRARLTRLLPATVRGVRWRARQTLKISDALISAYGKSQDEQQQRTVATARLLRATAQIQLGHTIKGLRDFETLVKGGTQAVAAAFDDQARRASADEVFLGEFGAVSNLALRARTLGGGDDGISRIAFEESTKPGAPHAPSSRRSRLLMRLLGPR